MTPIRIAIKPRFCKWCDREFIFERFYKVRRPCKSLVGLGMIEDTICGRCKAQADERRREEEE